jgi:hypothetical protein
MSREQMLYVCAKVVLNIHTYIWFIEYSSLNRLDHNKIEHNEWMVKTKRNVKNMQNSLRLKVGQRIWQE